MTTENLGPSTADQPFIPDGKPLANRPGSVVPADDGWYNLKFKFHDDKGKVQEGYAYYVGRDPTWAFWDYISATPSNGPRAKFKRVPTNDPGWMRLDIDDGNYLSCRARPRLWLYRSSAYPLGWEIADGKFYTNYVEGAVGVQHEWLLVPDAYYMRVDGGSQIFDCEWVPA